MSVEFPSFSEPFLENITACGVIDADDATDIQWPEERTVRQQAKYESDRGETFVRLLAGWTEFDEGRGLHVHLEFAVAEFFDGSGPPTNATTVEIGEALDPLFGSPITLDVRARFVVPFRRVGRASVLRPLLAIETESQGLSLRLTGGQFDIMPPPLRKIRWSLTNRQLQKLVRADVSALVSDEINEQYVNRALATVTPGFDALIRTGRRNARQPEHRWDAGDD